jgi:hypothetical protein
VVGDDGSKRGKVPRNSCQKQEALEKPPVPVTQSLPPISSTTAANEKNHACAKPETSYPESRQYS